MPIHGKLLTGAITAMALCSLPQTLAQSLNDQDRKFIQDAAKGGMHEANLGRLGLARGMSQAVKGLSQRLINDHDKANKELAALARQKSVALPADDAQMVNSMPIAKKKRRGVR